MVLVLLASCAGGRRHVVHHYRHHHAVPTTSFAEETRLRCAQGDRGACRMLSAMGE